MDSNFKSVAVLLIIGILSPSNARFLLVNLKGGNGGHRNQEILPSDQLSNSLSNVIDAFIGPNQSPEKIDSRDINDIASRCLFYLCFWGSSMVHMRNGGRRRISDVKVGDSVLAVDERGQLRFSQVIMQLSAEPEFITEFQVIRTKTGRNLTMTSSHLIYKADSKIASSQPLFAMNIRKGDFVFVFHEKLGMIKDEVVSNDIETQKGIHTPVTAHGNIIVDDILASCYSGLENHSLLHLMFAPLRWFNDAKNALSSMKWIGQVESSEHEQDDKGLHWYSEALLAFGNILAPEKLLF